jgi:hypothetical protein
MRAQSEADLLGRRKLVRNRVEPRVERASAFGHRLVEQVLLRADVGVERALLDAHRVGEVAYRGAVVALLREEARRLARQLLPAGAHPR